MPVAAEGETVAVSVTPVPVVVDVEEDVSAVVVAVNDDVTVMLTALDVLVAKVVDPPYTAVIECVPAVENEVASVAFPELSVPVPSEVDPSRNVTVPVAAEGETVAVSVTLVPVVVDVDEDVSAVVVAVNDDVTVMLTALDVLVAKVVDPPYTAVTECVPAVENEVASVAFPELSVPVPSDVDPSRNVTVPVAAEGETVAVSVTLVPVVVDVEEDVSAVVVDVNDDVTVMLTALDVLVAKVVDPPYTAVIECVPAVENEVASVAFPELSVPVPSDVVPSRNVTVPVAAEGETVAVSVTLVPVVVDVEEDVSAVDVAVSDPLQAVPLIAKFVGIALVTLFHEPLNPMPV
ncbi:MAG TPA: hypothetical protein VKB38_21520 [Terracidiphilus sp.]|nr:hypothetical protein [Terracidiphilus sp.]